MLNGNYKYIYENKIKISKIVLDNSGITAFFVFINSIFFQMVEEIPDETITKQSLVLAFVVLCFFGICFNRCI
jgi:hypothetical protein